VVHLTTVDIALCLLNAEGRHGAYAPFSIDTASSDIVSELQDSLRLGPGDIAHLGHARDLSVDEVVRFHTEAYERLGTRLAITGRSNAVRPLEKALDIEVRAAVPVVSSIRAAMTRAVFAASNRKQADKTFAAAVMRVVAEGDLVEAEVRRLALATALHDVVDLSDVWVEARGGGQDVLIFGHRKLMQDITHDWTGMSLVNELEHTIGHPVAAGIGLGGSARRSMELAESALKRAVREGGRCAFVLTDEGVVIGPLATAAHSSVHRFRTEDADVTALSKTLGFSVPTVTRLLSYESKLGGEAVSANDIARELQLSPPSGRRIIRVLAEHDLAVPVGISQPAGRGRPTNLFRLHMGDRAAHPNGDHKKTP
jgi:hypothetical protein